MNGTTLVLPPLRQSLYEDMACPHLYRIKHVEGVIEPTSADAARGIEIHEILSTYIMHLVASQQTKDLGFLGQLLKAASVEATEALERFRDDHEFDPDKIVGTEMKILLDEDFQPIEADELHGSTDKTDPRPLMAYGGRLDLVLLHSVSDAEIVDWKSYYRVVEGTFQTKFYPLLLLCENPQLQKVRVVLEFIRYGASRSVEYTRDDVPRLKELARKARARQMQLHSSATTSGNEASPGRHCTWCPLLLKGCPLAERNPYAARTPRELVECIVWARNAEKRATEILSEWIEEHGPVEYRDANNRAYVARFTRVSKTSYPWVEAAAVLEHWVQTHPEDLAMVSSKSTMSGIPSLLKARKRGELAEHLSAIARHRVETHFKIEGLEKENGLTAATSDEEPG